MSTASSYHLDALDRGSNGLRGHGGRAGQEEVLAEGEADLLDLLGGITVGERRHGGSEVEKR